MARPLGPDARTAIVVAGLVLTAGCLTGTTDNPAEETFEGDLPEVVEIRLNGDRSCDPSVVANCATVAQDPDAPYILRPFALSLGAAERSTFRSHAGVVVENVSRSVVLDGFEIRGYDVGIAVRNVTCSSCNITVKKGTIAKARFTGFTHGISLERFRGGLVVEEVSMDLPGRGEYMRIPVGPSTEVRGSLQGSSGIGLNVSDTGARIDLHDVAIRSRRPSAMAGISVRHFLEQEQRLEDHERHRLKARNVSLEGFRIGLQMRRIARADLTDITVTGNGKGIEAQLSDEVRIEGFSARNNTVGIELRTASRTAPARLTDGVVESNARAGLIVNGTRTDVEAVAFRHNGREDPEDETASGGLIVRNSIFQRDPPSRLHGLTVRGSAFEGNVPYGLSSGGDTVDARNNWWGDGRGPRVRSHLVSDGPTVGLGDGDVVSDRVEFVPWRRSPPSEVPRASFGPP